MYDDYEVVYESNINENFYLYLVLGIVFLVLLLIVLISMSRVFKKANRSGISAFIPIYNIYMLLEVANMQKSYLLPLLIPIVNIPFLLNVNVAIANQFKKSKLFGIGMTFLPFIYYPILAFNRSEYAGINLSGMNNQIENIPVIDDNKNMKKEIQVNEEVEPAANISIGLGKLANREKKEVDFDKLLQKQEKKEATEETPKTIDPTVGATLKNANDIYTVSYIETNDNATSSNQQIVQDSIQQPTIQEIPNELSTKPVIDLPSMPDIAAQPTNPAIPTPITEQDIVQQPIPNPQPQDSTPLPQAPTPVGKKVDLLASNTVVPGQDGYKTCPNCGTRVVDGAEICLICGSKLN